MRCVSSVLIVTALALGACISDDTSEGVVGATDAADDTVGVADTAATVDTVMEDDAPEDAFVEDTVEAPDADAFEALDTAEEPDADTVEEADTDTLEEADTVEPIDTTEVVDTVVVVDTVEAVDTSEVVDTVELAGTRVRWDWPTAQAATSDTLDFFAYPWPESRRYDDDGTLRLAGFPNPASATSCTPPSADLAISLLLYAIEVEDYRDYVVGVADRDLTAFGLTSPVYFAFDGPLSAALPSPAETLTSGATVFLVNVHDAHPRFGERVPLVVSEVSDSRYLPPHTLALTPVAGFPMAADSRYAAVVLRALGDAAGDPLVTPAAFDQLTTDAPATASELRYAAAFDALEGWGVARADVAAMTVFDTGDPIAPLAAVADAVDAIAEPAPLLNVQLEGVADKPALGYTELRGTVDTLLYQRGEAPCFPSIAPKIEVTPDTLALLISPTNWAVTFDADDACGALLTGAAPTVPGAGSSDAPRTEPIPFRLTVPTSALTPGATVTDLPLVLYGHGTGGSAASPLGPGREATELAQLGVATLSITGVMHDDRAHAENLDAALVDPVTALGGLVGQDLLSALTGAVSGGDLFFHPLNLYAARGNVQQSAVDFIWLARALQHVTFSVPLTGGAATVGFDPDRIAFFGHSQGGLTGPLTGLSADLDALMLSAPGGHLTSSLLTKTLPADPFPTVEFTEFLLCDPDHVEASHPLLAVFSAFFDPGDAATYMRHVTWEPLAGPKHVFVTEGVEDHYATPEVNEALTTAGHLTQVAPELDPVAGQALLSAVEGGGFDLVTEDLAGNLARDGAAWTAGFRQYAGGDACSDDHFVYLCVPEAKADWIAFFATWLTDDAPTIQAGAP